MKISFIATVFNEEKTIQLLLDSLFRQTRLPDEIIFVDGGSNDETVAMLKLYKKKLVLLKKKGNRSVGRNEAINKANGEIIVCSDAGNILDSHWIENITAPFKNNTVDVVAGFYKARARTVFQKAVAPYALVMLDKVNADTFLPATRSIAFTKKAWKKIGGFDENLSHNEDYDFARKLRKSGMKIVFAKDAIVFWIPRNSLFDTYHMMWRFAFGDAEAGIWRPKVIIIFIRYMVGLILLLFTFFIGSQTLLLFITLLLILYVLWSIVKNYHYVNHIAAIYLLPILQFTADGAVMSGTVEGFMRRLQRK